jgi:hypothetical protein
MSGFPSFSPDLKELVEKLEPGVHQFVHVPISLGKGGEPLSSYAVSVRTVLDDIVDYDRSPIGTRQTPWGTRLLNMPSINQGKMISIYRSKVAGKHLWVSSQISTKITISNELHNLIVERRLKGLDFIEINEVN